MKVWNSASWPGYKSKLGWAQSGDNSKQGTTNAAGTSSGNRKPYAYDWFPHTFVRD